MADQWTRLKSSNQKHLEFVPFQTFNYSINISLQYRYIFVETPKVCCSTIKLNLQRLETGLPDSIWPQEMDIHDRSFSPLLSPRQVHNFDALLDSGSLFKFCFVRDPYTRLLSCYLDKIAGNRPPKHSILNTLGLEKDDLSIDISFAEFVDAINSQPIIEMNPHWRPQYYQTFQNTLEYDFIGRYENFARDFKYILATISPQGKAHHPRNETRHKTGANQLLDQYYTPEILDKVNRIFEVDFTAFEYATVRHC